MTYDSEITNEVSSFCGQVKQITMAIKIGFYSVCNLDFKYNVLYYRNDGVGHTSAKYIKRSIYGK